VNQERYPFSIITSSLHLDFEFESIGPNGTIKKVVTYTLDNFEGITFFNLAFGHWREETNEIDDKVISNNRDRTKILTTVAATVKELTTKFPDVAVFATGSTPSRTRLYQMGLSANLADIETEFDVYGHINGHWQHFERNVNYDSFLVQRK